MDNAPYHSVVKEPHPKVIWKKARIVEWLQGKGETINADLVKTQLLDIAEKYRQPGKIYAVDECAKEHDKLVLRLPPYHCELNPIELAWAQVKHYIRTRNTTFQLEKVRDLVNDAVENVSPTNWQNYIAHVKKEERFRQLDRTIDSVFDEQDDWISESEGEDSDTDGQNALAFRDCNLSLSLSPPLVGQFR
ncbi:uncharacterized protein LOC143217187 [Lasioglossum baleicum]|uniref:uncharacterized protein LOC143217187 n=1 Tax=Lasioglossum baleicum TaxID=434251 RepID=UPI003FCD1226